MLNLQDEDTLYRAIARFPPRSDNETLVIFHSVSKDKGRSAYWRSVEDGLLSHLQCTDFDHSIKASDTWTCLAHVPKTPN